MKALVKRNSFWVGLVVLSFLVMMLTQSALTFKADQVIYDASLGLVHKSLGSADKITIVTLQKSDLAGEDTSSALKEALVRLLKVLDKAHAKSITIFPSLAEPQSQAGLSGLDEIQAYLNQAKLSQTDKKKLTKLLAQSRSQLDVDHRLYQQIHSPGNIFFPFHLAPNVSDAPEFIQDYALEAEKKEESYADGVVAFLAHPQQETALRAKNTWPIEQFASSAKGLGYLSQITDTDGITRSVQLLHAYDTNWLFSLPLALAVDALRVPAQNLEVIIEPGSKIKIGNKTIPIDETNQMLSSFYSPLADGKQAFPRYQYADIVTGGVAASDLKGKIVFIEAPFLYASGVIETPIGSLTGIAELTAHAVASILNQDVYAHPNAFLWIEYALFLLVALYLLLLLPRLGLIIGSFVTLLLLVGLMGAEAYLLLSKQVWLHVGIAILLLVSGYVVVAVRHLFSAQHAKHAADIYYTNRQLGLLLQERGKLEQAFECFQKLPADSDYLDLIYNLGLDFERKRKFNNAASAFHFILDKQPGFRDVNERVLRAEQMQHSISLGTGQFSTLGSLLVEGEGEKPMLGRFVIEKELGKGAMGSVYLGRDPKIDRVVAVKTLALAREFENEELKEVESRFFHEASAAGRLNHPNIVTIYDAEEDHDLAYIAMEYIEGKSLADYVHEKKLLPVQTVLMIIAKAADALEYAGKEGIVHRDIKPANIMYNVETNVVKITDFGIARIASSGKTKTGMVLGTPSYMSPEQMSGGFVDARSDIFSLAVTMFVLLTGKKAFFGDSLATISYQIVNGKHPDITTIRKDLPVAIKRIIDKALQKDPEKRYQSGIMMKRAILRCLKEMGTEKVSTSEHG